MLRCLHKLTLPFATYTKTAYNTTPHSPPTPPKSFSSLTPPTRSARRTEIFHQLSNKTLATPEKVKLMLISRIPFHSPLSMVGLYHRKRARHAVKSCFSQKKTNRLKKVNKLKKQMYSQILGLKLYVRMSSKAYRCIRKLGSFDRYILLTNPKDLDSKMGEYYRTLMLRKINDPDYRIPYVIGSGRKTKMHQYQRYRWIQKNKRLVIPKDYKQKLITFQRKFGTSVEQFDDEDYEKYLEVEKMKKLWGREMDTKHPLLLQIQQKLDVQLSEEEISIMEERAEQYKQEFLDHPTERVLRQQYWENNEREAQKEELKIQQAWLKMEMEDNDEEIETKV